MEPFIQSPFPRQLHFEEFHGRILYGSQYRGERKIRPIFGGFSKVRLVRNRNALSGLHKERGVLFKKRLNLLLGSIAFDELFEQLDVMQQSSVVAPYSNPSLGPAIGRGIVVFALKGGVFL